MTDMQKYLLDHRGTVVDVWGGYPDKSGQYEAYGYQIVGEGLIYLFNSDGSLNKIKGC